MKRKKMSPPKRVMHSIHNQKFWTEFFSMYESLPVLWDMNNRMYKDRQTKCDAYDILVDKLREIEPTADREDVVRKINIFRTNYRRECARINISLQEGRKYQSTLWYLDLLSFIQTADTRRDRKRNVDEDGEKSIMRKRRAINVIRKSPEKKDNLIEYEPHSTHEFEYDLEEHPTFKYVPDELSHVLVDGKVDSSTESQQNSLGISNYHDVEEERAEDNNRQEEFTYYAVKRGVPTNKKINLSAYSTSQLDDEITTNDNLLELNDASEEHRSEYGADNETETLKPAEWCIKTENSRNSNADTNKTIGFSDNPSIKFVRDVMTMTLNNNAYESCSRKLLESSEILSKSWAVQYDELNQDQKVLARKAINDILFEGYMGHLAMGSSGRVTIRDTGYKTPKTSPNEEVESSEVYEQSTNIASSGSSTTDHGSASSITLTTSVASTSKVHTNEEWIKL